MLVFRKIPISFATCLKTLDFLGHSSGSLALSALLSSNTFEMMIHLGRILVQDLFKIKVVNLKKCPILEIDLYKSNASLGRDNFGKSKPKLVKTNGFSVHEDFFESYSKFDFARLIIG